MDTDALRYFQQVADGATVTEVAELYQVSQPGVSRSLRKLESELGATLLERSGRLLRTTQTGQVFKRHVDTLLHALDDGLAAAEELIDPETGTVALAFQLSLGSWLVPAMIAAFRADHPHVSFTLQHSDDKFGSSLVAGGSADLAITARRPRNPDVHWQRLFTQPLRLAVPHEHRLVGRRSIHLIEAADEDFVALTSPWELREVSDDLCERAGFTPRVVFETDDIAVMRGFVSAGLGVAIVPPGTRASSSAAGTERLVRLDDPTAYRDIGLSWSATRRLLPSAELFRQHVIDTAGNTTFPR